MNEKLNLVEILKDCPKGTKLYSTIYGEVEFDRIGEYDSFPVVFIANQKNGSVTADGKHFEYYDGECTLFPSKNQRDWSKFTAPWYKNEKVSSQTNERAWLYLISDVLTWKDGIGQYLDDPRVQELAKRLCSEYAQKLYNPSADKIELRFNVGDWVVNKFGDSWRIDSFDKKNYQVSDGKGNYNYFPISKQDEMHLWTIQDAKDGDVLSCNEEILLFKSYSVQERISLYCWYNGHTNNFHSKEVIDTLLTKRNKICPATKEQRDLLFQKNKEAGYKWNDETKTLEKLVKPKFKVGDKVRHKETNKDDVYEISKV